MNQRDNDTLINFTDIPEFLLHPQELKANLAPYLVILSGCDQGKQFKLERSVTLFGRDREAHIAISDPKISRLHGALTLTNEGVVLEDLNSSNGTYVDGVRIGKHTLELLNRIQVGNTSMKIDFKTEREAELEMELYRSATVDALTGIMNRGAFMTRAQQEFAFCKRMGEFLTIVMCDADHFKAKNDEFGHLAGDYILKEMATIIAQAMRTEDVLARYGGEEFIMMLRGATESSALAWAERTRCAIMDFPFTFQERTIPATVSIGVCCQRADQADSLQAIIQAADAALYQAKQNGRNCTAGAQLPFTPLAAPQGVKKA